MGYVVEANRKQRENTPGIGEARTKTKQRNKAKTLWPWLQNHRQLEQMQTRLIKLRTVCSQRKGLFWLVFLPSWPNLETSWERGSWLHRLVRLYVRHCQFPMMQKEVQPCLWSSLGRSTWAIKWSYLSRRQSTTFLFLLQFQFKFLPRLPSMVTWKYKLNKSSPFGP